MEYGKYNIILGQIVLKWNMACLDMDHKMSQPGTHVSHPGTVYECLGMDHACLQMEHNCLQMENGIEDDGFWN